MDPYRQLKSLGLWLGIILIAIGGVLLLWPNSIIKFLAIIIGVGVLLVGLVKGILAFKNWNKSANKVPNALLAILLLILGIYVLSNTNVTITAIGMVIGIFAIISALDRFSVALARRKSGHKFAPTIIFGLINFAFGIGMIVASLNVMSFVLMLVGIYLVVAGIMVIVSSRVLLDL